MPRLTKLWLLPLLLVGPLAVEALAQFPPKSGRDVYEETVRYGFRIKVPKDWKFFPDERGNPNVLGRYMPERNGIIHVGDRLRMQPAMWMLVFDKDYKEPKLDGDTSRRDAARAAITQHYANLDDWIKDAQFGIEFPVKEFELLDEEDAKIKGTVAAKHLLYLAKESKTSDKSLHVWATTYDLDDRRQLALVFEAPSDKKHWGKWRSGLKKIAKTFARVELEELDMSAVEGSGVRAQKHRKLLEMMEQNPGWELYATPNYFVISNSDDDDFIEEITTRLEAIREQYEIEFPEELAQRAWEARLRVANEGRKGKDGEDGEAGGAGADGQDGASGDERSSVQEASPLELSRCSVVRVCANKQDYMNYGGPSGSAGYWWSAAEELVIYDDQAVGGRRNTWATLNHEAFHQFIFYFFGGALNPGTWYNEGNADFYSGYKLTNRNKYELNRFDWRNQTIQSEIREGKAVPLKTLVGASKAQYYAQEPLDGDTFSRYPHGWSFTYFLRTGKKNRAKNWNDDWNDILSTYLNVLIDTQDVDKATEEAFAGVDWEELEAAWEHYILKGK